MKYLCSFIAILLLLSGCIIKSPILITGFTLDPDTEPIDFREVISITVNISYQGENDLTFSWNTSHGTITNDSLQTIEWTAPQEKTDATITVVVSDGISKNEVSESLTIQVRDISPVTFTEYQLLNTHGALDWEYFTMDNEHFLVVANHFDGDTYTWNSPIYKWDNSQKMFNFYQNIETYGATDWEYATIDNNYFLIVANSNNNLSYNTNSISYVLSTTQSFAITQTFPTNRAMDWKYFAIS